MSSNELLDSETRRLRERVVKIASRARRLAIVIGLSKTFLAVLFFIIVLGWFDYQSRWSAPAIRWIATGTLVSIVLLSIYRFLLPALRWRFSTLDTARLVEGRLGLPRGWLSSIIEFIERPERRYGDSVELYRDAVRDGVSSLRTVPMENIVSPRGAYQAALLALTASGFALAIFAAFPQVTKTAMRRLLAPWSETAWPRNCQLEFLGLPSVAPRLSHLEFVVVNRLGRIPSDVQIEWQYEGETSPEKSAVHIIDDRAYGRISSVSKTVLARATSKQDTSMPWQRIVVAGLPQLVQFEFDLTPPSYTGLEPLKVMGRSIRVLEQTRYRMRGRFDLPVRSIAVEGIESASPIGGTDFQNQALPDYAKEVSSNWTTEDLDSRQNPTPPTPLDSDWKFHLSDDGKVWVLEHRDGSPLVAERGLRFGLRWESMEGLVERAADRFDIEVTPDLPPNAEWSTGQQWNSTLAGGAIAIHGRAVDDLQITATDLHYELADLQGNVIKRGQLDCGQLLPLESESHNAPVTQSRLSEMQVHGDFRMEQLESGQTLALWLSTIDSAGQRGESERRMIAIKTEKEILAEIGSNQNEVVKSLSQAQAKLRQTQSTLNRALGELEASTEIDESLRRTISNAAMQQEAAQQKLETSLDSATVRLRESKQRLAANGLIDSDLGRQIEETAQQIAQVAELTRPLHDRLHDSAEQARNSNGDVATVRSELAEVAELQNRADEMISSELARLGFQESFRDLQRQLLDIANQQSLLREQTAGLESPASARANRAEMEKERNRLASVQRELARQLDQFSATLARTVENSRDLEAAAAESEAMGRLEQTLSENGVATQMREAAELLSRQQIEQSRTLQQKISETLKSIVDPEGPATETVGDELDHLLATTYRLLPRQNALVAAIEEVRRTSTPPDSFDVQQWVREQSAIRKDLESVSPNSNVNEAFRFVTKRAAEAMNRAAMSLERSNDLRIAAYHSKIAVERLQAILNALESNRLLPTEDDTNRSSNAANSDDAMGDENEAQENTPILQSLELLRSIQIAIRDQLQALQEEVGDEKPSATVWLEWSDLATEQESISEQWMRLLQKASETGEGNE